ncbi:hypothetical protein KKA08_08485 [bacterium]|nr:hypothetical protein [bacterium]
MKNFHPIWRLAYNAAIIPSLYLSLQVARLFNKKVQAGIKEREGLFERLEEIRRQIPENHSVIVIHCASAGEFEAARPLLDAFRKKISNAWLHVTFYSPSGSKPISKAAEVDSYSYLPFDAFFAAKRFFDILNPAAFIIVKHDIWPNLIWEAQRRSIPSFWINANLHRRTRRLSWFGKGLNRSFLKALTGVLTVDDEHAIRFSELISPTNIDVLGYSRYDRTLQRMQSAREKAGSILADGSLAGKKVIVAGSTWGPDHRIIIPAYAALKKKYPDLFLILVPHEPHESFLSETTQYLRGYGLNPIRYSQLSGGLSHVDVLVIDKIGILAVLYQYAWIAYVGGAFGDTPCGLCDSA